MKRLGAFELQALLARGGMGSVWRGRYRATHTAVAVKLLRSDRADSAQLAGVIAAEAAALAALDHPQIVRLVDWGQVAPDEAADGLEAGLPYLVLEFVGGGDLSRHAGALGWTDLRRVLLGVLEGLAHAHARDVVHLDIKPGNVLLVGGLTSVLEPRLTDFGVARRLDRAVGAAGLGGTPGFMAPEVGRGDWRWVGPWTDLFSVGGLGRFLLDPEARVPEGLEGWIARMMAPDPTERPFHAAWAAEALRALEGQPRVAGSTVAAVGGGEATFLLDDLDGADGVEPGAVLGPRPGPPPVPEHWQPPSSPLRPLEIHDAGSSLFALRSGSFVGREAEWDRLWALLRQGNTAVVRVGGRPGMGASRLAAELLLRSRELGVGMSLPVRVGAGEGLVDGLRRAFLRWFRLHDETGSEAADRARDWARMLAVEDPATTEALDALGRWCAGADPSLPLAAFHRLLAALSATRPVLLWIDEVQHLGPELGQLAPLFRAPDVRLLGVFTVTEPAPEPVVEALEALGEVVRLEPGPLDEREIGRILSSRALVQPRLVDRIHRAVGGNPGHAVELFLELHEAGRLVAGRDGLEVNGPLPTDSLTGLTAERVGRALDALSEGERRSLERAARLGREVSAGALRALEASDLRPEVLARLRAGGVLEAVGEGLRFASEGSRQEVVRRADARGFAAEDHRSAAAVLEGVLKHGEAGLHWLDAGEHERAAEALVRGAVQGFPLHYAVRVRAWVSALEQVVAVADWPEDDPRRGEPAYLRAYGQMVSSRLAEAEVASRSVLEQARERGWRSLEARTLWMRGRIALYQGDLEGADRLLAEALPVAEAHGSPLTVGRVLVDQGRVQLERGAIEAGRALLVRGTPLVESVNPRASVLGHQLLADVALRLGELDEAERRAHQAMAVDAELARDYTVSHGLLLGSIAQARGDLDAAEGHYRSLIRRLDPYVVIDSAIAMVNLAVVRTQRGDHTEAVSLLERAAAGYRVSGRQALEAACHALLLEPLTAQQDHPAVQRHLAAADRMLRQTGFRHEEIREGLERAAKRMADLPWPEREALAALVAWIGSD